MQALFRVLMLVFLITGLALSVGSASAQQFSPPLAPDFTPQWTPIPGAPGVQHTPDAMPTCSAMARGITISTMAGGIRPGILRVRGKVLRTFPGVFYARSRPIILGSPQNGLRSCHSCPRTHAAMDPDPGSPRSALRPQCQCRPVPLWAELLLPA